MRPRRPLARERAANVFVFGNQYALWHALEREVRRALPLRMSFLRFTSLCVWEDSGHEVRGASEVMIRDRGRCTSPVCTHHGVQAHHIVFRSAGGSDDPSNLTAPCFHCHLRGLHLGRLTATSLDGRIRWVIGRAPLLVVDGRERMAA